MFSDPQSVTINSVAKSMPRVETNGNKSIYKSADGIWTLTLSHQTLGKGRVRTMVRLDQKAIVTNPLDSTDQDYDILTDYHVFDRPEFGFTVTQLQQQVAGLSAWLDGTAVGKLFGLES
jgi:hypothetical protein